jgi:hypothetical protein
MTPQTKNALDREAILDLDSGVQLVQAAHRAGSRASAQRRGGGDVGEDRQSRRELVTR